MTDADDASGASGAPGYSPNVKPPSTLLMGEVGTGKSWAIHSYLRAGLKVIAVVTEPGGEESILNACERTDTPVDNLHWKYIPFASTTWDVFEEQFDRISRMDYEALSKLKMGPGKGSYNQLVRLHEALSNFTSDRTGEVFGPVDKLDDTHAVVLDSISGLNQMCMDLVIGAKPVAHQGEWGVAMATEERIINKFTSDMRCFFCATAHLARERDEVTGRTFVMPQLLGTKLSPRIPRMFSDVVLTRREGTKFFWSTIDGDAACLKARNLDLSDKLQPSFVPIVEQYRKRKQQALGARKGEEQT